MQSIHPLTRVRSVDAVEVADADGDRLVATAGLVAAAGELVDGGALVPATPPQAARTSDAASAVQAEAIATGIPRSELTVLEESAHYAHLEETERYLAVLVAFLDRADSGVAALTQGV